MQNSQKISLVINRTNSGESKPKGPSPQKRNAETELQDARPPAEEIKSVRKRHPRRFQALIYKAFSVQSKQMGTNLCQVRREKAPAAKGNTAKKDESYAHAGARTNLWWISTADQNSSSLLCSL